MFEFEKNLRFDPGDYLVSSELSETQKKRIDDATLIFKDNIVGEIKKLGGTRKENEAKFEEISKKVEAELKNFDKDYQKDFKNYINLLAKLIEDLSVTIVPVKEMPWPDVFFCTIPRIVIEKNKLKLLDNAIAYYGEIKCVISRTIIFGKIKGEKPLFAPIMGDLEIDYKIDGSHSGSKSESFSYINAIINSLEKSSTRSHLTKYLEAYQAHGDPICDFLKKNDELMNSMEALISGLESKRLSNDIAICGIAIPHPTDNTSLLIVIDEGQDSSKYSRCFEGLLRFSAACCEAPSTRKGADTQQAPQVPQTHGVVRTPGGQELKTWTATELAEQAQQRSGSVPPGMAVWNQEELLKMARERGNGIPEGMEVWDEESLKELTKRRQGGNLNIPEWEPESEMKECSKCGYTLREGWKKCPICETPVDSSTSEEK